MHWPCELIPLDEWFARMQECHPINGPMKPCELQLCQIREMVKVKSRCRRGSARPSAV